MNLYLITQDVVNGYDTYDSAVVAAKTAEEAKRIHPDGKTIPFAEGEYNWGSWASKPEDATAELIGKAKLGTKKGVICASFNAG